MKAEPIWTAACARRVDALSINKFKIPQTTLMDRAGAAVAEVARPTGKSFLVLAGDGNNGGDALIAAKILAADPTLKVTIVRVGNAAPEIPDNEIFNCIIDGIFGLGFRGPLDPKSPAGIALKVAAEIKSRHGSVVVAVDLPSGLSCDDASQDFAILPADDTVTFGGMKAVHAIAPARDLCGRIHCIDIGFSSEAVSMALNEEEPAFAVAHSRDLLPFNPWSELKPAAHKYDRGHVLVMGGSAGKIGAPVLSALAALRSGAGWATLALPDGITSNVMIPPDLTSEALWARGRGRSGIDAKKLEAFLQARKVRAVVVGPGTMENPLDAKSLTVLAEFSTKGFVVLDAGALHGIFDIMHKARVKFTPGQAVLTPHPGEWARLSQKKIMVPSPLGLASTRAAHDFCITFGLHLLYKHSTPVLCGPDRFNLGAGITATALAFNEGSNIMGRAGTGDVLAGCIAAHGAIDCDAATATMRALAVVSAAARMAASQVGAHAVLPSDIIGMLGRVS